MERSEGSTPVVCDAGPLIHLDQLDGLDLLADLGRILVPETVWAEVERHRPGALRHEGVLIDRARVEPACRIEVVSLVQAYALDAGEAEALALMERHRDSILLTDDAAARLVAEQRGHEVHGTIGVLVRAVRRGLRTREQVMESLEALPMRSSLHVRRRLLSEIIETVRSSRDEAP